MASDLTKVELIPNENAVRSGLAAYGYLLSKYGFNPTKPGPFTTVPQDQSASKGVNLLANGKANGKHKLQFKNKFGRPGRVPASVVQNDFEWLCPVKVGTPAKTYKMIFDTGSADLWLWSTELPPTVNTSGRHLYNPAKSRTFTRSAGSTWKQSYNDQISSASGSVGTDLVNLGGLKIRNQTIQLADTLSPSFQTIPGDGLLGLAFGFINHVSPVPVATAPENLAAQGSVPKAKQIFTTYLSSYRDAKDRDNKSFYTFGFVDQKALRGQTIHYADIDNSQGLWQFQSTSASVGDRQVALFDNTAVADTGSSLALIDDSICGVIYDAIPGSRYDSSVQGYVFPTNTTLDQLPVVKFAVGDQEFAVQKEDLAYADVGEGYTYGGIQSRGDLSFDVLGDTFLKSVYSIFDQGNSRFGVVVRTDSTQLAASITPRSHEPVRMPDRHTVQRRASPSTDSTSFGIKGYSSMNGVTMVYGSLILLLSLFSARGSVRLLLAGLLCLCLLQ
ncbi:hypothetical protein MMC07_005410 [Pseudocyphellaria aurata]|nr:hypothetical protein [Pseudocyphellaria aurata]